MTKNEIKDVLGFWYSKERFKSVYPGAEEIISDESEALPWDSEGNSDAYMVFGGKISNSRIDSLLDPDSDIAKTFDNSKEYSSIYIFSVNQSGNYKKGSFRINNYLYLFSRILLNKNLNELEFEIASINEQIDSEISRANPKITTELLENLNKSLGRLIFNDKVEEIDGLNLSSFAIINGYSLASQKHKSQKLNFLRKAINEVEKTDTLYQYIEKGLTGQFDILNVDDLDYWDENLNPKAYPKSAWPRKTLPNASQQWIINDFSNTDSGSIKSYNAQRYSHRSLIVENYIAQSLEEKADYLLKVKKPADAFAMSRFSYPPQNNSANYYNPANNLSRHNMILTGVDREKLKSIVSEIIEAESLSVDNSSTSYFDLQRNKEIYLTEVINKYNEKTAYMNKPAWGAAAVYVETRADLQLLVDLLIEYMDDNRFYFDKENPQFYLPEFKAVQDDYFNSKKEAIKALEKNEEVYKSASIFNHKLEKVEKIQKHIENIEHKLLKLEEQKNDLDNSLFLNEDKLLSRKYELDEIEKSVNFWQKLLYKFLKIGEEAKALAEAEENLEKNEIEIQNIKDQQDELVKTVHGLEAKIAELDIQIDEEQGIINALRPQEEINKSNFGRNYIDRDTYLDINSNRFHNSTPWEDESSFKARYENFYRSMQLNRTFVLRSNELKQNLKRMKKLLNGEYEEVDEINSWQSLFSSLQLIVPLIAMPKATLENLLEHAKIGSSGTVVSLDPQKELVDELVSTLYIADRAIFLGDFMQMNVIDKFNKTMQRVLLAKYNASEKVLSYKSSSTDYLLYSENKVIALGNELVPFSVRVQNRIVESLFSLQNEICLDNLLLGTVIAMNPNPDKVLEQSTWMMLHTETGENSLFTTQSADIAMVTICEYFDKHQTSPNLGIAFFYNDVYQKWLEFSRDYLEHKKNKDIDYVEKVYQWIKGSSFLLGESNGREFEEVIFIAGASLDTDEKLISKFISSVRPLNTLFNTVKRNLMILADSRVWANTEAFAKLYSALNGQSQRKSLKQKELTFVTFPFKANLLDEKSETTETYSKLKETIQNTGIKLDTDVYYSGDVFGIKSLIEATYAEDAGKEVVILNKLEPELIENEKNDINPISVVEDILHEMDRLSQNKAVIIVDKKWVDKYLELINKEIDEDKLNKISEKSIKPVNTLLNVKFNKLENLWNLAQITILKN